MANPEFKNVQYGGGQMVKLADGRFEAWVERSITGKNEPVAYQGKFVSRLSVTAVDQESARLKMLKALKNRLDQALDEVEYLLSLENVETGQ